MFSSSLHRSSSVALHQSLYKHAASISQVILPLTPSLPPHPPSPRSHFHRPYHSDNAIYGFKEKPSPDGGEEIKSIRYPKLQHLVNAYRHFGHLNAATNPLRTTETTTRNQAVRRLLETRAAEAADEDITFQDVILGSQFSNAKVRSTVVV